MDQVDPYRSQRVLLIEAGLLVPAGEDGLYGLSGRFESIVSAIEGLVERAGSDQAADVLRFPPVMSRSVFERTGYLRSFPNLIGSLQTFDGTDRQHAELLRIFDQGEDWTQALVPAATVLCSAACHPLYPTISGPVPDGGRRWNVYGWVFRHEPSLDPARLQAFRQYEFVYVGEPEGAVAHRDLWRDRALSLLGDLGLDVVSEVANDPFFGRLGRMLTANQQESQLKFEILAQTGSSDHRTAITSANCHEDHFGHEFDIRTGDGRVAHSACVGFGVERVALALLWEHGVEPQGWPPEVRSRLWP